MTIQWSLVLFTVLSGCGAGLFACTALDEFRGGAASKVRLPACAVAVALLVVGGIASATHLSHVDRMMAVLAHPTAGIFLEALLLGLLAVCIAVYALLVKREASSGARKALAATGIVLAVAFAFACGVSYMMTSRPVWNTVALPLAYLGTALATGAALYLVMCAALKVDEGDVKKAGVYAAPGFEDESKARVWLTTQGEPFWDSPPPRPRSRVWAPRRSPSRARAGCCDRRAARTKARWWLHA